MSATSEKSGIRQKALQEELRELVDVVGPGPLVDVKGSPLFPGPLVAHSAASSFSSSRFFMISLKSSFAWMVLRPT